MELNVVHIINHTLCSYTYIVYVHAAKRDMKAARRFHYPRSVGSLSHTSDTENYTLGRRTIVQSFNIMHFEEDIYKYIPFAASSQPQVNCASAQLRTCFMSICIY